MRKQIALWLNNHIKHPRDTARPRDYGIRLVIHAMLFPLVTALLMIDPVGGPIALVAFTLAFMRYQRSEDRSVRDQAWKDHAGYLWALGLGVILYLILRWLL